MSDTAVLRHPVASSAQQLAAAAIFESGLIIEPYTLERFAAVRDDLAKAITDTIHNWLEEETA